MLKHIRNILLIFISIVAVGYFALVFVYLLPIRPIQENVLEASNIMYIERSHQELIYGHQDTMLDNLTDAIMLGTARYDGTGNAFEEALLANRFVVNGMMDSEVLGAESLGEELVGKVRGYGRYWHGYLLYLKPLLLVFNYGQIRYLVGLIQFGLFVEVVVLLMRKKKEQYIIPFITAYLFLNPTTLSLSLQYFPASVITMLQLITLLLIEENYKKNTVHWLYHFFIVGCFIAYFDLLTFPLVTLGIPLAFLMAENHHSLKEEIKSFMGSCVAWAAGYAMMWGSKWILGTLITKENMIKDALGSALFRIGATESETKTSAVEAVFRNIGANKLYLLTAVIVFICVLGIGLWRKYRLNMNNVQIILLLCALLPFAWYVVLSNHSYIHYWFTYRVLAISIFSVLIAVVQMFEQKKGT